MESTPQAPGLIFIVVMIALYLFYSYCLVTIAKKTGNEVKAWWGWIPVVQAFLMLAIAKKPMWWFILLLIPIVNIVFTILVGMEMAKARNKPAWLGILMIVPLVNMVVLPYLAFAE